MPQDSPKFTIEVTVVRASDKAWLVHHPDMEEGVWIPKSMVEEPAEKDIILGEVQDITIPEWLAIEKGFFDV